MGDFVSKSSADFASVWKTAFALSCFVTGFASTLLAQEAAQKPTFSFPDSLTGQHAGEEAVNSIGQKFSWCPAGSFLMGSPADEPGRSYDEEQVEVRLSHGFWMAQFEVTEKEYQLVRNRKPKQPRGDDHPSTEGDPRKFAEQLTEREQQAGQIPKSWIYTLPTEAEWEYACRAGSRNAFSFGDSPDQLHEYGNFADRQLLNYDHSTFRYASTEWDDGFARTAPVGSYRPNRWGLYDMHGNVWEWCLDRYDEQLTGGIDPVGPEKSDRGLVIRGGSWLSYPHYCRSAMRKAHHERLNADYVGFRVVLKPKPSVKRNQKSSQHD